MGVHGLWNLFEPVGKPVPLETLENKVLAVDVSIWLHQATKGFRDAQGNPLPNAHLIGLCHRLCKLLYFRIKPIFVFDGGVPILKRQTMARRHERRDNVKRNNTLLAEKILENYLKSEIINKQLGKSNGKPTVLRKKNQQPDLFQLPPMPNRAEDEAPDSDSEDSNMDDEDMGNVFTHLKGHNIHTVDFTGEAFRALPVETQHEILLELRDTRKQSSWNKLHQMPQEASDFSGFQMERLLKRRNLQQRIDEVVKEIGQKTHEMLAVNQYGITESNKIVSDSSAHYVLMKKALEQDVASHSGRSSTAEKLSTIEEFKEATTSDIALIEEEFLEEKQEFSQQELFAMLESNKKEPVVTISSSDEGSDFEEVPCPSSPPHSAILLDIPIDPAALVSEDDDMFSDIFGSQIPTKAEKIEVPVVSETKSAFVEPSISNPLESTAKPIEDLKSVQSEARTVHARSIKEVLIEENITFPEEVNSESTQIIARDKFNSLETNEVSDEQRSKDETLLSVSECATTIFSESTKLHIEKCVSPIPDERLAENPENELQLDEVIVSEKAVLSPVRFVNVDDDVVVEHTEPQRKAEESATGLPETSDVSTKYKKASPISEKTKEALEEMGRIVEEEQSHLIQQHGHQERLATSITDQMYIESQELLRLFGIPYLVAPMEAEAQCAFLDEAGLTQGTITDDSDIWLFGGRRVYKNFFNNGKYVELFKAEDIQNVFKLGRDKLILLALLTGSDYTEGIQGVGPVCALEILSEFPSQGYESLVQFREWLLKVQAKKNAPPENKIRQKLRNLQVNPGFPNPAVIDAYSNPEVNPSRVKFTWSEPDLDALRDYLNEKVGWNRDKFNSVVVPVLERFKIKESQTRIDSFFSVKFPSKTPAIVSKRVLNALRKADFGDNLDEDEQEVLSAETRLVSSGGKRKQSERIVRNKKIPKVDSKSDKSVPSTSNEKNQSSEIIWQRESDKQKLAQNKIQAIELFKKSKGRGKRQQTRPPAPSAHLSESDSD